ncbi:hypothetical protein [Flavobacterium aquicola]|uniref:Uncharacterized protein n=1 Tax=Flavobacterium aquicola TaxID=1682742 RepID=A0A3E0ETC2_9FLAO|nr:hypothetical protein [Flavobacterium aquicola]REH00911.1 hypothetical protein C8P67_102163 [Flavobacterium aquicola]
MDKIKDAIDYLEGSIVKFSELRKLVNSSTDIKQKTKLNETLYEIMEDAKEYIKEYNLYQIALDVDNAKPRFDGLINTRYFEKDIGYLVMNLKAKVQ